MGYRRFRRPLPLGAQRTALSAQCTARGDKREAICDRRMSKIPLCLLTYHTDLLTILTLQVQIPNFGRRQVP